MAEITKKTEGLEGRLAAGDRIQVIITPAGQSDIVVFDETVDTDYEASPIRFEYQSNKIS